MYTAESIYFQMRRLALPFHFDLLQAHIPTTIICSGSVAALDPAGNSFAISLSQSVGTDLPLGTLTTHVRLLADDAALPTLNEPVTCSGSLLTVVRGEPVFMLEQM